MKQVINKAILIAEAFYLGYSFLFMFDNATSHAVYAKNALCARNINKSSGGKQVLFRDGWFETDNDICCPQQMSYLAQDDSLIPKSIQRVLEEKRLWPESGLNLECLKPKCYHCQSMVDCKSCVKGSQCQRCKIPVIHNAFYSKARKCDTCIQRKASCQYVAKQYCTKCSSKKGKCMDCEELPPQCISEGN